ncbi:MAG TPA: hypothetical protein VIJ26_15650 [Thermoanaerobaculia bacterium]
MSAELDALLAEPLEMLSTADQLALTYQWETLVRRQAALGHRLVAVLAAAPVAEFGGADARGGAGHVVADHQGRGRRSGPAGPGSGAAAHPDR